ncbi:MAG: hypothetical protein LBP19_10980 [Treponema sp.]|jgi:hypothetical protein|nr:hypothetical protein [Treponema sp.]
MAKLRDPEETGKNILADVIKNPPIPDRDVVFRYSSTRRLERAPRSVQDLNKSRGERRGVFAALTGTRSNAILLITILVFCAFISIINRLLSDKNTYMLGGNSITVSALRHEGNTFIVIKKRVKQADAAYTGAVDVAVSPEKKTSSSRAESGEAPAIFTSRLYFMPEENEEFRISVPLDIEHALILMQTETERVVIRTKAE